MYLFTRNARIGRGHARDGIEWAIGITEKVNQITSLNVGLWTPVMSPGVGTLSWGCIVEHLTDIEDADAKLMADSMYLDAVDQGANVLSDDQIDDTVAQFLTPMENPVANPTHATVVRSALANGRFQQGVETGIEIAQRVTSLTGVPTAFLLASSGTYGGCAWLSAATSLQQVQEAEQRVNADADFIDFVDRKASPNYLPGATSQAFWRRVI